MIIRISPNSREADLSCHCSAMSKLEAGDYENAIKDYTNILKRNPNGSNELIYNEIGQAYESLGDLDAACAIIKEQGRQVPKDLNDSGKNINIIVNNSLDNFIKKSYIRSLVKLIFS